MKNNKHNNEFAKVDLLKFERTLFSKGYKLIAGIDEVGRGPLAGPMVLSAVILNIERVLNLFDTALTNNDVSDQMYTKYSQINDSKKITAKLRCDLSPFIINECVSYSIYELSNSYIDTKGISKATQEGFTKVLAALKVKPDYILTDHFEIKTITQEHQSNIDQGDAKSISIAAASIVAKVYRDKLMTEMHTKYPLYGFDKHKGYGTKEHIAAITKHGICKIHRLSFEPIKSLFHNKL